MKQCNSIAYLYNKGEYSFFKVGREIIRFATSPYLIRYTKVKEYDNGYIVVDAEFMEPDNSDKKYTVEEYIDIEYILNDLKLNTKKLSNITGVNIV